MLARGSLPYLLALTIFVATSVCRGPCVCDHVDGRGDDASPNSPAGHQPCKTWGTCSCDTVQQVHTPATLAIPSDCIPWLTALSFVPWCGEAAAVAPAAPAWCPHAPDSVLPLCLRL